MKFEDLLLAFIVFSLGVGAMAGHLWGGSIKTGLLIGLVVGLFPIFMLIIGGVVITRWCPERPGCKCDKSLSEDYEFLGPFEGPLGGTYYYKCPKCEREYRQKDKRFELRLSEDEFEPYMAISKYGRWKPSPYSE